MDISKVEQFLGLTISKDILKNAVGDGAEFDLIYEAMISSIESNNNIEADKESTIKGNSLSQKLESIPLRIREESIQTGEILLGDINTTENIENKITDYFSNDSSIDMDKIYSTVDKYCSEYGVDKNLVLAIIKQESNFNTNAVSSAGAKGLMQIMDFNLEAYGVNDAFDIEENIGAGVKHIKSYLDMYNGNTEMALMAYNAGPGTIERRGVNSLEDLYKMPEETQNYVSKIMTELA